MVLNQSIKITEDTKKKLDERKKEIHPRATYDEVINESLKISGVPIKKLEEKKE